MAIPTNGVQAQADAINQYIPDWLRGLLGVGQVNFQQTSQPLPSNLAQASYGRYLATSTPQINASVAPTSMQDVMEAGVSGFANMPGPAAVRYVSTPSQEIVEYTGRDLRRRLSDVAGGVLDPWVEQAIRDKVLHRYAEVTNKVGGGQPVVNGIGNAVEDLSRSTKALEWGLTGIDDAGRQGIGLFNPQTRVMVAANSPYDSTQETIAHELGHAMGFGGENWGRFYGGYNTPPAPSAIKPRPEAVKRYAAAANLSDRLVNAPHPPGWAQVDLGDPDEVMAETLAQYAVNGIKSIPEPVRELASQLLSLFPAITRRVGR